MTDFPTFFHILQLVKSLLFHIPEAVKKVPLYVIIGSNPPGDQMQAVNVHRASIFSVAREDKGGKLLYPLLSVGIVKSVYKNGIFAPLALKRLACVAGVKREGGNLGARGRKERKKCRKSPPPSSLARGLAP